MMSMYSKRNSHYRRNALATALALGLGLTGVAYGQSTTGSIFGTAPVGDAVQIVGGSGFNRTVPVSSDGRYSITVPVGNYTVNLIKDGAVVHSHNNVSPSAGGASEADFEAAGAQNAQTLSTVTVTGNALPTIDVTSTNQNLTITAKQLTQLPLARSAAAIALLAPGTTAGAAMLGGSSTGNTVISFGGSTIVENAYYINGFDTSDPLSNTGGIALPYGSIDQQQTLTSGYGAQYGRSTGGVISQIGKSGTNEWHFGGQALWRPAFAQASSDNIFWSNPLSIQSGQEFGNLESYNRPNSSWETIYDAYVGGPLIKDKLFFFLSAETDKSQGKTNGSVNAAQIGYWKESNPKLYGKIDWNINDNNILSLTYVHNEHAYQPEAMYAYDNTKHQVGQFNSLTQRTKNAFNIWIGKYTSYITDNLTLNAMVGKMDGKYYAQQAAYPGYDPTLPYILNSSLEDPGYTNPVHTTNASLYQTDPSHSAEVRNLRLDLDWKLGEHDIQFGIDNSTANDRHDGQVVTGPQFAWEYGQTGSPSDYVVGTQGVPGVYVGPTLPCVGLPTKGCYVDMYVFNTAASVTVKQRAQYVQDNWQVLPNVLLNIGLRNDQFTNYNPAGEAYLRLTKPQWAPRIGFSWDVFGDSSMKVFGNAGRYYLAMPAAVALREAGAPLFTRQYYTYTGISPDGIPTNPQLITNTNLPASTNIINASNGQPIDPKLVAAHGIKAEYQDQFVLGMQQSFELLDQSWVYGATGTVNKLGRVIDDVYGSLQPGPYDAILAAAKAQGVPVDPTLLYNRGSILINPGQTNTLTLQTIGGGYGEVKVTPADFGYPPVKRKYYSMELYLEHPFDGKWFGKVDYVFSRSYGDTEGPVQSTIGQGGSSQSATEQWDFGQIMSNSNGLLASNQKHQLRVYGSYQVTPEWMVGGTYLIASGHPVSCLGLYGPDQTDPGQGYGSSYHWCNGLPAPSGSNGSTPWTHQLNLQVDYRPAFAEHKLDFSLQVHNVFNEQKAQQYYVQYNNGTNAGSYNPQYMLPYSLEAPRYVQLGVAYDY